MKYLLLLILIGCNVKSPINQEAKDSVYKPGEDVIIKIDTVYIHDTIIKYKNKVTNIDNAGTVNIGSTNQTGGQTANEINNQ